MLRTESISAVAVAVKVNAIARANLCRMAAKGSNCSAPSAPMIVRGLTDPKDPRLSFKDVAAAHHRIEEGLVIGEIVMHIDL